MLKRGQRAERTRDATRQSIDRGFVLNRMKPRFGPRLARSTRSKASDSIARSRSPSSQRAFSRRPCSSFASSLSGLSSVWRFETTRRRRRRRRGRAHAHSRCASSYSATACCACCRCVVGSHVACSSSNSFHLILYWTAPLSKTRLPTTASTSCSLGAFVADLVLAFHALPSWTQSRHSVIPRRDMALFAPCSVHLNWVTISFRV